MTQECYYQVWDKDRNNCSSGFLPPGKLDISAMPAAYSDAGNISVAHYSSDSTYVHDMLLMFPATRIYLEVTPAK